MTKPYCFHETLTVTATFRVAVALACVLSAPLSTAAQELPAPIRMAAACAPVPSALPSGAPRIVGGDDPSPKTLWGAGEIVAINVDMGRQIQIGQRYFVRRAMDAIGGRSPHAEDTAGWLTIVAVNQQSALAKIDFACTGIVSGDHLEPYVVPALPPDIDRTDASGELDFSMLARVMYGEMGRVLGGTGDFMLADMGQNQGVQPGARFAIYRDVYLSQQVPPVSVGEAVVVSTVADNSLIRLTQTRDAIRTGDRLVARKRVERAAAAAAAPTTEVRPTAVNAGADTTPKTTASAPAKPVRSYMFEDVYFDFDRYTLRPQATSVLDEAVTALQQDPTLRLQIEGHTCNIGTAEYNLALGSRRAQAVSAYLTGRGIPAGRLTTVSYGEERPKYDNSQEETRRQNRRASLVVSLQQ